MTRTPAPTAERVDTLAPVTITRRATIATAALALALAGCGATTEPSADPAPTTEATTTTAPDETTEAATTETVERTDLTVFINEPPPMSIFVEDNYLCTPYGDTLDGRKDGIDPPIVTVSEEGGEIIASQELIGDGMLTDDGCMMHLKFLEVPVVEEYQIDLSGTTVDGEFFTHRGYAEFDQGKYEDGYTQGYTFDL